MYFSYSVYRDPRKYCYLGGTKRAKSPSLSTGKEAPRPLIEV